MEPHSEALAQSVNPGGSHRPVYKDVNAALREYGRLGDHYRRYLFARGMASHLKVLDYGCGYGFGALILGTVCREYVGVDVDERALGWARTNLTAETLATPRRSFMSPKEFDESYPDSYFDLVTCFEVIEHLSDPLSFLERLKRKATKGGMIIVSTPNGSFAHGQDNLYGTEFHIREFDALQFARMLLTLSSHIELFREDRIDFGTVIWRRLLKKRYMESEGSAGSPADAIVSAVFSLISQFLNGPAFWRITPLTRRQWFSLDYSDIIGIARIPGP